MFVISLIFIGKESDQNAKEASAKKNRRPKDIRKSLKSSGSEVYQMKTSLRDDPFICVYLRLIDDFHVLLYTVCQQLAADPENETLKFLKEHNEKDIIRIENMMTKRLEKINRYRSSSVLPRLEGSFKKKRSNVSSSEGNKPCHTGKVNKNVSNQLEPGMAQLSTFDESLLHPQPNSKVTTHLD